MIKKIITASLLVVMMASVFTLKIVDMVKAARVASDNNIVLWVPFSPQHEYTSMFEGLIREFEQENPGTTVTFLPISFYDYFSKIRTAQSGKSGPDVSINDILTVKYRAQNGMIKNLEKFMSEELKNDFYDADVEFLQHNDEFYAVPFSIDARFFYYNKDHFRANAAALIAAGLDPEGAPTTLEEITRYNNVLTKIESNGRYSNIGFHPDLGNNGIQQIIWSQGGEFFENQKTVRFNTPDNVAAVQWWVDSIRAYNPRNLNIYLNDLKQGEDVFISQKVSMVINGDWLAWDLEKYFEENPDQRFDYGVAMVPYTEGNASSWSGSFTVEMSEYIKPEKEDMAFKLIEYLLSEKMQTMLLEMYGWRPGTLSGVDGVYEDPKTTEQQKFIFDHYHLRRHVDYNEAVPEWLIYFQSEISRATANDITAQEAVIAGEQNLQKAIDRYYGKYDLADLYMFGVVLVVVLVVAVISMQIIYFVIDKKKKRRSANV